MPKVVDHDLYRKELLQQCFDLFAEKGYAAITMRQIAQGLGVSTGTLYHYFPSKQAIFEQMVWARLEEDLRECTAELEQAQTIEEQMQIVFSHFEACEDLAFKELVLYLDFYQHQKREGALNNDNVLSQVYASVTPKIREMLRIEDPELIQFLFSILDGLVVSKLYGCQINWKAQAKLVAQMLTAYLHPSSSKEKEVL